MSVRVMSAVWDLGLPPMEKLVLLALADCANDEGRCWPSATTLARKTGEGERTVRRAVQSLIAKGHLVQQQRTGTSPIYTVNPCQSGTPAAEAPLPERPETPARAAPKPLRTINGSEAKASKPRLAHQSDYPMPAGVDPQVWADFLTNRRRKNKPNTPSAHKRLMDDLRRLSDDEWPPGRLLEHAAANGWAGIYDPREGNNGQANRGSNGRMGGPRPDPTLALVRAATAAQREDRGDYGEARPALPSR